jgi:hypothetical protein
LVVVATAVLDDELPFDPPDEAAEEDEDAVLSPVVELVSPPVEASPEAFVVPSPDGVAASGSISSGGGSVDRVIVDPEGST